jgi:hypothetical protein
LAAPAVINAILLGRDILLTASKSKVDSSDATKSYLRSAAFQLGMCFQHYYRLIPQLMNPVCAGWSLHELDTMQQRFAEQRFKSDVHALASKSTKGTAFTQKAAIGSTSVKPSSSIQRGKWRGSRRGHRGASAQTNVAGKT